MARAVCVLRPNPQRCSGELLAHYVKTQRYQDQALLATGSDTALNILYMGDLENFTIPLPTDPGDMRHASRVLGAEIVRADLLLREASAQIGFLREHRQALITSAISEGLDPVRGGG